MEFFKKSTNIDFIGQRKAAFIVSILLLAGSIVLLVVKGLNLGVDFTGGTVVELSYQGPADLGEIRSRLQNSEFGVATVQNYGTSSEVLIRLAPVGNLDNADISDRILSLLRQGGQQVEMRRIEFVGSQVGEELTESGGLAMIFALLGILVYVALRFQTKFALSAVLGLLHDVIITFGFFSLTGLTFDLTALAAVLTVIGYSLNDTIVVFDRIRDNFRRMRKSSVIEIFNKSMNQTLSRTIMTGVTTLMVLSALFILGGETLHAFSLVLILGIIIGTFSTLYIASPLTYVMGVSHKDLMPVEKEGANLPDHP